MDLTAAPVEQQTYLKGIFMQHRAFFPFSATSQAVGLSLYQVHEGEWEVTAVWLTRKGNKVEIKEQWEGIWPAGELAPSFPKNLPVALVLDGKGILHKPLSLSAAGTPSEQLLKQVLPGAGATDFCVQQAVGTGQVYLSLLRNQLLDEVLSALEQAGYVITFLSVGPFAGAHLAGTLLAGTPGAEPVKVRVNGKCILIEAGKVASLLPLEEGEGISSFTAGEETLPAKMLSAYCVALEVLLGYGLAPQAPAERIEKASQTWQGNQKLKQTALTLLLAFFAALLLNFFAFSHYTDKLAAMEQQAALLDPARKQTQKLAAELQQKEVFLRQQGWLSPSKASYYADRLAATVPKGVRLRELSIYPVDEKRSREEKRTVVNPQVLLIRGVCNDPKVLNEWFSTLSDLGWAQQLSPPDYRFGEREGKGRFSIQIHLQTAQ